MINGNVVATLMVIDTIRDHTKRKRKKVIKEKTTEIKLRLNKLMHKQRVMFAMKNHVMVKIKWYYVLYLR